MRSNSITSKVHNTLILFTTISIWLFSSSIAYAENWGVVTIQSTHGYGSTASIHDDTIAHLENNGKTSDKYIADDPNNNRVPSVLSNLRDNDVLIINAHSNSKEFGVGDKGKQWAEFYNYWRISKPSKLGLVIVHGCIFDYDSQGKVIPATDRQIQDIRKSLNADAIISFNTKVFVPLSRRMMHQLIMSILKGRKIASEIKFSNLRFLVDSQIDRNNVTLADLVDRQHSGGNTRTISNPKVNGIALDYCREWARNCGKPAADAWCRANGYKTSVDYAVTSDTPPTRIISTGKICDKSFCDRIVEIKCIK